MEMELDAIDLAMMERLGIDIDQLDQLDLVEDYARLGQATISDYHHRNP